jgi:HEAT repeat protein
VARSHPGQASTPLIELLEHGDFQERLAAMRAMAEVREASFVPALVHALGDGSEGVVSAAHAALVQVTRQDFGADARPWLKWWEQNAERHRLEWLIDALTHEVSELRRLAGEELRALSKQYFGFASDLPPRDRERAQRRYRDWWITEGRARQRQ